MPPEQGSQTSRSPCPRNEAGAATRTPLDTSALGSISRGSTSANIVSGSKTIVVSESPDETDVSISGGLPGSTKGPGLATSKSTISGSSGLRGSSPSSYLTDQPATRTNGGTAAVASTRSSQVGVAPQVSTPPLSKPATGTIPSAPFGSFTAPGGVSPTSNRYSPGSVPSLSPPAPAPSTGPAQNTQLSASSRIPSQGSSVRSSQINRPFVTSGTLVEASATRPPQSTQRFVSSDPLLQSSTAGQLQNTEPFLSSSSLSQISATGPPQNDQPSATPALSPPSTPIAQTSGQSNLPQPSSSLSANVPSATSSSRSLSGTGNSRTISASPVPQPTSLPPLTGFASTTSRGQRSASANVTLKLGQGLPTTVVTNLPATSDFIFLAFSTPSRAGAGAGGLSSLTTSTEDSPSEKLRRQHLQRRQ